MQKEKKQYNDSDWVQLSTGTRKMYTFFKLQLNSTRQLRDLLWQGCLSNLTELGHQLPKNASEMNQHLLLETGGRVLTS